MEYGYWRTDKPKDKGYSHEFISSDTAKYMEITGATLDSLDGHEYSGIDTLLGAFENKVQTMPDNEFLGTRNGDTYDWITWK